MGTFRYRDIVGGRVTGESRIRVQRLAGGRQYSFSNVVDGALDQRWNAVISPGFTPLTAELTFGGGETHKAFELSYSHNHVSGIAAKRDHDGFVDTPVGEDIAPDTVDQRIDWAAVMALKSYRDQQEFTFHVYDPKDGNARVVAAVKGREILETKAGRFHVLRIVYRTEKAGGAQTFEVFINERPRRFLVKEIFPWGETSELVEMKPDSKSQ